MDQLRLKPEFSAQEEEYSYWEWSGVTPALDEGIGLDLGGLLGSERVVGGYRAGDCDSMRAPRHSYWESQLKAIILSPRRSRSRLPDLKHCAALVRVVSPARHAEVPARDGGKDLEDRLCIQFARVLGGAQL